MAGSEGRSLEKTPTWAVAVVCLVMVALSIVIEHIIHLIGQWLKKKHKRALYESLEKVKSELMLLGFISLLLTVGQGPISEICVSESVGNSWHPCKRETKGDTSSGSGEEHRRRLLNWSNIGGSSRRVLVGGDGNKCADEGKVSFISQEGLHQLHIFIFVLAVFHVLYCILTMAFGRLKMRRWTQWEKETRTAEYQFSHDPERFRFARETSFGRRHMNSWSQSPILLWIVCFFRQFLRSVPKIILLVGTKLQVIIARMGLSIQARGEVVKGMPTVQLGDELFWFHRPRLILYLINFVLFQNAFQLAFLTWSWYEFGQKSCFHESTEDIIIGITMGVLIQIMCSYVTLPLYALVTQMGSTMKPTIFNERVATALKSWHRRAKKQVKKSKISGQVTPMSSRPGTPTHGMSPVHLLRNYRSGMESSQTSPRRSNFDSDWETDMDSPSPSYMPRGGIAAPHHHQITGHANMDVHEPSSSEMAPLPGPITTEQEPHEVVISVGQDFSFHKRTSSIYESK